MKVIVGWCHWCAQKFRLYVVFHKSIPFILGLIFGIKLVEDLFMNILVTYLIPPSKVYDLKFVAILINLSGGISSVLAIFMAFVADAYVGLFHMLVSASTLSLAGMVMTHFAAVKNESIVEYFDEIGSPVMFGVGIFLLTLSEAAIMGALNLFFSDQILPTAPATDQTLEEDRVTEQRIEVWLGLVAVIVSVFLAIFTLYGPWKDSYWLIDLAKVLAIVLGATFFIFLLGFNLYNRVKPTGSALRDIPVIISDAIIKRNVDYPQSSDQISPHVSWLRWLDKAAHVQENRLGGRIRSSVEQVEGVKSFLKMLPMWSTFIAFGLVYASGDTFFIYEAYSITGNDNIFPVLFLWKVWTYAGVLVSVTASPVFEKLSEKMSYDAHKMMLVRIGIGMLCCVLCCIAAWSQAAHRLYIEDTYGDDVDFELKNYMSVYRLSPQFVLLGFMEGFSLKGLQRFFETQVPRQIYRYGPSLGRFVMGFGRFVSIGFIFVLSKCFAWFKKEPETSRLDDIYLVLGGLSGANLVLYCVVARWYHDNSSLTAQTQHSSSHP